MTLDKQSQSFLTQLIKSEPASFQLLKAGDLLQGHILEQGSRRILVDLGKYGTGVVYRGEILNAKEIVKTLKEGGAVNVKVISLDNEEGYHELSLAEASRQKSWGEVKELEEKDEPIAVKISGFNKGGLIAEISGLQAFLPTSQLSQEHYPKIDAGGDKSEIIQALQKLVGQEFKVKIIDVNPRTNKFIISEKEAQEVTSREFAKNYEIGQVVEGIISGVADFGAFVRFTDNPQVEGLIHVSELDWRTIENPKEVIKVDDVIQAKIIEIKDGKISLSLKALKSDPWLALGDKYKISQEVLGKVYAFNPFGATIDLSDGLQGQIHVTEFGGLDEMKRELTHGQEYNFLIQEVKPEERRINLKLKK